MVLSDALAVQFHGLRVSRSKDFKSQSCFGISKMYWDPKKWFGISKNVLESQKMVDIVEIVHAVVKVDIALFMLLN